MAQIKFHAAASDTTTAGLIINLVFCKRFTSDYKQSHFYGSFTYYGSYQDLLPRKNNVYTSAYIHKTN